jgi:hypothetical protein
MYKVLSMFRNAGYRNGSRYQFLNGRTAVVDHDRDGRYGMTIRQIDNTQHISPVHGIPMKAKDTLLAQLMQSSTGRWLLTRNTEVDHLIFNTSARYQDTLNGVRGEHFQKKGKQFVPLPKDPQRIRHLILNSPSKKGKLLSVEIECYNLTYTNDNNGFTQIVHDGSLSSRGSGRELRRISWVDKSGRLSGLLGLEKHFKGAWVDKTCGLHVHVDARHLRKPGMGVDDFMDLELCDVAETYDRLTLLYPVLKRLIPRSRWNNKYCKFVNNREGSDTYRCPSNGERYAAINWRSYYQHSTIEFRLGSGSTNLVKIESWALICQFLFEWCSKRNNTVPTRWPQFLAILPGWMKDWCIMRNLKLHGGLESINERTASAADFKITSGVSGMTE